MPISYAEFQKRRQQGESVDQIVQSSRATEPAVKETQESRRKALLEEQQALYTKLARGGSINQTPTTAVERAKARAASRAASSAAQQKSTGASQNARSVTSFSNAPTKNREEEQDLDEVRKVWRSLIDHKSADLVTPKARSTTHTSSGGKEFGGSHGSFGTAEEMRDAKDAEYADAKRDLATAKRYAAASTLLEGKDAYDEKLKDAEERVAGARESKKNFKIGEQEFEAEKTFEDMKNQYWAARDAGQTSMEWYDASKAEEESARAEYEDAKKEYQALVQKSNDLYFDVETGAYIGTAAENGDDYKEEIAAAKKRMDDAAERWGRASRSLSYSDTLRFIDWDAQEDDITAGKGLFETDTALHDQDVEAQREADYQSYLAGGGGDLAWAENLSDQYARDWSYKQPRDDWTEEESNTYFSIYASDKQLADEYAIRTNNLKNAQIYAEKIKPAQEFASVNVDDSEWEGFLRGAAPLLAGVVTAPEQLFDYLDMAAELVGRGVVMQRSQPLFSDYADEMIQSRASGLNEEYGTIKTGVFKGKGAGDLYQLSESVLQSMTYGAMLGPAAASLGTSTVFFGSAAKSALKEATEAGATPKQALTYSVVSGLNEAAWEYFSMDKLMSLDAPETLSQFFRNFLAQGFVEGSEEFNTTLADTVAQEIILRDKSSINRSIQQYLEQGMSLDRAQHEAWGDWSRELAADFAGGFVSGSASGGAGPSFFHAVQGSLNNQTTGLAADEIAGRGVEDGALYDGGMGQADVIRPNGEGDGQSAAKLENVSGQTAFEKAEASSEASEESKNASPIGEAEAAATGEAESTAVNTDPSEHSGAEQAVIDEYQNAVDDQLVKFAETVIERGGDESNGQTFELSRVSGRAASDISKITGIDVSGFKTEIQGSMVKHIYNDHGPNGTTDQSMRDMNDLGRLQYVLDNYDQAEAGKGSKAYRTNRADGKQGPSKTVVFSKAVNGTYYVVEAVPDTKARTTYIVSAYMTKKRTGGEHAADAEAPTRTAKTEGAHTSVLDKSISPSASAVNAQSALASAAEGRKDARIMEQAYHEGQDVDAFAEAWSFAADVLGAHTSATVAEARQNFPSKMKVLTDAQLDLALTVGRKAQQQTMKKAREKQKEQARQRAETAKRGESGKAEGRKVQRRSGTVTLEKVNERKLDNKQKRIVSMVKAAADVLSFDFVLYEGEANSGGAYIQGGKIRININSGRSSGKYLGAVTLAHEITHALQEYDKASYEEFKDFITNEVLTPAELERLVEKQLDLEPDLTPAKALDEVVANGCAMMMRNNETIRTLAEKNRGLFGWIADKVNEITDRINKAYEEIDLSDDISLYEAARIFQRSENEIRERWNRMLAAANENKAAEKAQGKNNTAEGGGVQNMYFGEQAREADMTALETARSMEKNGTDAETIRKETGWFRGMDGKWRFEIDDSKIKWESAGDIQFRKDHPEYDEYRNLLDKMCNSPELLTEDEQKRLVELDDMWSGELSRLSQRVKNGRVKLGNVLRHESLFRNYPGLKDVYIEFADLGTSNGHLAARSDGDSVIRINKNQKADPRSTLIHEIQHAIQHIEGFATGSSPEAWSRRIDGGYAERRRSAEFEAADQKYRDLFDNAPEELKSKIRELNRAKLDSDLDLWDQIEAELYDGPYGKLFMEIDKADMERDRIRNQDRQLDAYELYRNTAGEIEARDAQFRQRYDQEKRRNTPPDMGDENTVFADAGDEQFNIDRTRGMPIGEQLKEYRKGNLKQEDEFHFGLTPKAISPSGFDAHPLAMSQSDFTKSKKRKHNVPPRVWKKVPGILSDPILSFEYGDRAGFLTKDIDGDGKPLVIGLQRNVIVGSEKVNKVKSAFGVDSMLDWVESLLKYNPTVRFYDIEQANKILDDIGYKAEESRTVRSGETVTLKKVDVKSQNQKWGIGETAEEQQARKESVANLKAENRILRARAEYWKGQTQQTRERSVRQQDTDRLANDLLRKFDSRAEKDGVKEKLKALGDWLVQNDGDTLSYDDLHDRARGIAEEIIDGNYTLIDDSQKENLDRLKDYLKSTPVKLTAEDWRDTGDENFRRRYGRYFTVSDNGRTIDSLWGELAATFGDGVFPEDTYAPGDMLNMIGDYLDLWKPQYGNIFEANWEEAVDAATGEIIDRVLGEEVRQTAATFADKAQQKLNAQIAADKEKLDALRAAKNERIEQIKRQATEKAAQIRMAEKAAKYEAVSNVKQHYQDMMKDQRAKRTETAGQRKYRTQVAEKAARLEKMLLTNSDKLHVPEVLKAPLADFLSSIDFSSKSKLKGKAETRADVKFQAALTALTDVLTKQERYLNGEENAEDRLGGYLDISQEGMDFLREMTEEIHRMMQTGETYTVNAMSAEQLQGLSKLLSNISSAIRNMNSFMANARYQSVQEAAEADIRHMESLGSASEIERGSIASALAWENGTPYYVLKRFGEGGKAVFDSFTRGWEKMAFNVQKVIDFTEQAYTDKEVKSWKSEMHEITLSDGSEIRMTTAQIMALSQLLGREQAVQHITKGGIRIGDIQGEVGKIVDTKHYHLTAEDISSIIGELTPRQMNVARALQRFMAHQGAIWGNEVSMRRFGYNFYDEGESYYPIRTDSNDRGMQDTEAMQNSMFRLLNLSASKSINPKASNALIVEDIFDTFADHMADMAKLNGMGLPVLDAIKWFNYKERIELGDGEYDTRTLQGVMEQAFGEQAQKYFRTLMKDINGVTEAGDRGTGMMAGLIGNYKAAAVGANLRVAFLQPTSYVRAAAILQPKYLAFAFTNRNAYKEALANSGTAVWKSLGYYDTNISRGMREQIEHNDSMKDKIVEASMSLAELGDKLTWGRLWVACKMQAKATNSSLEGKALIDATGDLFREVVYATQVMDSTLTRSELMRGKTLYSKAMTAFMAEPTLSYNLLMDAVSSYRLDVKANGKQGAWKRNSAKIGTAFGVYAASTAFAAVVESVADAFRDDDNDEFWQKFLEALLGEGITARIRGEKTTEGLLKSLISGNLAQDLTIIGKLPYVKSMASTLQGYKSKDMSSAAFDAIIDAVKIWQETAQLANGKLDKPTKVTYYGNMTDWGKIYKTLQGLSQLSGIGASNFTRDALALWNSTVGEFRPDWKIKTYQSKAERTYLDTVYPHGVSWSAYQSAISAMDTDENGSVKQDEAGPYLRGELEAGRLTEEQAEAIWAAATSGKKSFSDWLKKNS